MIIGACGITCELCPLLANGKCEMGGCLSGTDEKAPEKLEKLKAVGIKPCPLFECAVQKKVDYCLRCPEFPCELHYRHSPYCVELFDYMKDYSAESKGKFKLEK